MRYEGSSALRQHMFLGLRQRREDDDLGVLGGRLDGAGYQARHLADESQGDHSAANVWPHGCVYGRLDGRHFLRFVASCREEQIAEYAYRARRARRRYLD